MALIRIEDIQMLADSTGWPHISIYMPAEKAGRETRQNPIRFKNLLDTAADQLRDSGMSPLEVDRILEQAHSLRNDAVFWQQQEEGLAVLINDSDFHVYQLPREFPEEVQVGERFALTPLLQFLYEGGDFYILALSQNEVRLLKGTPYSVSPIDLDDGVPASLAEALRFDDPERQLQWHSSTREPGGVPGQRPAIFHGHGGGAVDDPKTNILRFFHILDKGITEMLKEKRSPLVLAGVDYLLPIYQEANGYQHLVEEGITLHPKSMPDQELHAAAWKLVKPIFDDARNEISDRYALLKGHGEPLATNDLKEIVVAAPFARVEVLFIDKHVRRFGTFDPQNNQVTFVDEEQAGSRDMIEFAALETLRNGGIVYALEPEDMPAGEQQAAAILRY